MTPNCFLSPEEYKSLIYSTLIDVDFCASSLIDTSVVDFYWSLQTCWSRCDRELHYLLTRREVVKHLMMCNVYQVDRAASVSESNSRSDSKACSDGWNQAQATSHSANWSDSLAEARSTTSAVSRGESESSSTSYTEAHSQGSGTTDTVGFGSSYSDGVSDSFSESESQSDGESLSTKEDGGGIGTFSTSEDYQFTHSLTEGFGFSIGIAGAGRTATEGQQHTFARSDDIDDSEESRFGHSKSDVRSANVAQTTNVSNAHSFTQAVSDTFAQSSGVTDGATTARGSGLSTSHSEGLAQSSAESRNRGTASGQNTSQSHDENTSESTSNSVSTSSSYSIKYNQRYKHLTMMYDNLTALIEYKEHKLNQGQSVAYGYIMCQPLCDRRVEPERVCATYLNAQNMMDGAAFWA